MYELKDVEYGLEINKLEKYLKNKQVAMIGLLDGIGYTPNGYNYLHKMLSSLKIEAEILAMFNAHFKTFNREHYIEDMIAANVSLREIKNLQYQENEEKIKEMLREKNLPEDQKLTRIVREFLNISESQKMESDRVIKLKDIIRKYNEVNIFYSANTALLNQITPYQLIKEEKRQRRRNYHYILSLNPKTQIYAIGLIPPREKNKERKNDIDELNHFYQELSSEFGMVYINTRGLEDFLKKDISGYYLNQDGIDNLSFRCIQAMYQRKIEDRREPNFKIECLNQSIQEKESESGIKSLMESSTKREKSIREDLALKNTIPFWLKNFLRDSIEDEQQKQKIYRKAKED